MRRVLTALVTDIDDMAEAYRIRRAFAVAVGCLLVGLAVLLAPWPADGMNYDPECRYSTDEAGQLWQTLGCDQP